MQNNWWNSLLKHALLGALVLYGIAVLLRETVVIISHIWIWLMVIVLVGVALAVAVIALRGQRDRDLW
jgi:uncharacterized membrane protein YhaH (DUF805 family)